MPAIPNNTSNPFLKAEPEKRSKIIPIRVTESEYAAMEAVTTEAHGDMTDLIRTGIGLAIEQRRKVGITPKKSSKK